MKVEDQQTDTHADDSSYDCSPFLSCGSSSGFVAEDINTHVTHWAIAPATAPSNVLKTRDYFPKIWQPPKLS